MDVRVIEENSGRIVNARILPKDQLSTKLPSFFDGWRFDFAKHSIKKKYMSYALFCTDSPEILEGCLIFELKSAVEPYMAFIELAPHNRTTPKKMLNVAECLIAFACRLSFIHGKHQYLGWLAFDVLEENKDDEIKLMSMYSKKYNAVRLGSSTTMLIQPEDGEKLINDFLNK